MFLPVSVDCLIADPMTRRKLSHPWTKCPEKNLSVNRVVTFAVPPSILAAPFHALVSYSFQSIPWACINASEVDDVHREGWIREESLAKRRQSENRSFATEESAQYASKKVSVEVRSDEIYSLLFSLTPKHSRTATALVFIENNVMTNLCSDFSFVKSHLNIIEFLVILGTRDLACLPLNT
jgi:hypothetical protein